MKNVHSRWLPATPEVVRPWIERAWSGTDSDPFPRDVIPTWRRNPDGQDPQALTPGATRLGHGPFRFRLRCWDGERWEVDFMGGLLSGWHGFEIRAEGTGTRLTHTLEVDGPLLVKTGFELVILPIHDWVLEALFDRLEIALATGRMPGHTVRPMRGRAQLWFGLLSAVHRIRAQTIKRACAVRTRGRREPSRGTER